MPWLIVEKGPERGRNVELQKGAKIVFGRDATCDFVTADAACSRRHFSVVDDAGTWKVVDHNSTHGTYLNGWRVQESKVDDGDSISAGETVVTFALEGSGKGLVGKVIAGYQILERIGRGGMGTVYKAKQIALDRIVALKVLSGKFSNDKIFINRFFKEAQAAARLNHPNVVQVYDVREEQGLYLLSIEIMDRGTIQDLANEQGQLPIPRVLEIARDAALGLVYAEKKGIVHGDIKPDNLMINSDGHIKISDLGLAREAGEAAGGSKGAIFGTPHFVSPEQAQGLSVDSRSDIYSLGATLYRLLAGATPFTGETVAEIVKKQINDEPEDLRAARPDCPEDLADLVAVMMAKSPAERFGTAHELLEAINALDSSGRLKKAGSSKRLLVVMILAALVLIGGPAAFFISTREKDKPQPPTTASGPVSTQPTSAPTTSNDAKVELQMKELEVERASLDAHRFYDQVRLEGKGDDPERLGEVLTRFRRAADLHPETDTSKKLRREIADIEKLAAEAEGRRAAAAAAAAEALRLAQTTLEAAKTAIEALKTELRFGDALAKATEATAALKDGPLASAGGDLVAEVKSAAKTSYESVKARAEGRMSSLDFEGARGEFKTVVEKFNPQKLAGPDFAEIDAFVKDAGEQIAKIDDSKNRKLAADRAADQATLFGALSKHYRVLRDQFDLAAAKRELAAAEASLVTADAVERIRDVKMRLDSVIAMRGQMIERSGAATDEVRLAQTKTIPAGKVAAMDDAGIVVEKRPGQSQNVAWAEVDPKSAYKIAAKRAVQAPADRRGLVLMCVECGLFDEAAKELEDLKKAASAEMEKDIAYLAAIVDFETKAANEIERIRGLFQAAKESGKGWFEVKRALGEFTIAYRGSQAFLLNSDGTTSIVAAKP